MNTAHLEGRGFLLTWTNHIPYEQPSTESKGNSRWNSSRVVLLRVQRGAPQMKCQGQDLHPLVIQLIKS